MNPAIITFTVSEGETTSSTSYHPPPLTLRDIKSYSYQSVRSLIRVKNKKKKGALGSSTAIAICDITFVRERRLTCVSIPQSMGGIR